MQVMEGIRPIKQEKVPVIVPFAEVLSQYDNDHADSITNEWARDLLHNADAFYEGEWHRVALSGDVIQNRVTLMYHHHPFEGTSLIPETGSTVAEAAQRLRELGASYSEHNHECDENIRALMQAPLTHIVLASNDGRFKIPDQHQQKLIQKPGTFLHLDGLYRMVAWCLAGRLDENAKIDTYIAGPVQNL